MSSSPSPNWGVQPKNIPIDVTQTNFLPGEANYRDPRTGAAAVVAVPEQSQPVERTLTVPPPVSPDKDRPLIGELLRDFAKNPGCERYSGDAEKIKLLGIYLWLRQLTPTLFFETFLELFAPLADFDGENLKQPDDAIKALLPRSAKAAEAAGTEQWTAKQVVEFVSLYVDIVREAELQSKPVPMTLNAFLQNKQMHKQYRDGLFDDILVVKAAPKSGKRSNKSQATVIAPSAPSQRCLYNGPGNRQYRGHVTNIWTDNQSGNQYANFKADSGEEFNGVGLGQLSVITDSPPNPPATPAGEPIPQTAVETMRLKKVDYNQAQTALALQAPMGNIELGQLILGFTHKFFDGKIASIHVINAEPRPYVDAFLSSDSSPELINETVIAEIPPRNNIEGTYAFVTEENGVYTLTVTGRE